MLEIREARPEEWERVGALTQAAWDEFSPAEPDETWKAYYAFLRDVEARAAIALVLVALADGEIVGTVTLEFGQTLDGDPLAPEQASMRMLAVAPEERGQGTGRALVAECLQRTAAAGRVYLTLHTAPEMRAAQHVYRSFGFERWPEADYSPGPGYDLLAYQLRLPQEERKGGFASSGPWPDDRAASPTVGVDLPSETDGDGPLSDVPQPLA
ncbi:MAG: GNAT family N-acetyltransferase [Gaiellaceae bacterium]